MAEITAKLVKELREKSGAGVMDAKKALVEVDGDIEKAIELLREKGMAKAAKKADRVAAEGLTGVYVKVTLQQLLKLTLKLTSLLKTHNSLNWLKKQLKLSLNKNLPTTKKHLK